MKKQFIGDCVNNPFASLLMLSEVVENARDVTKQTFLRNCEIDKDLQRDMGDYPNDYSFSKHRDIYFFTWSSIEHFYN